MCTASLIIPKEILDEILYYLIPEQVEHENVAFLFMNVDNKDDKIQLRYNSLYRVKKHEYLYQSMFYIELKEELRPKLIKRAFDLHTALVEVHSHPYDTPARFSASDMMGFKDFVPHVRWRLGGLLYTAIVFSLQDFDALVWDNNHETPTSFVELVIDNKVLKPNGKTLSLPQEEYYGKE